MSLGVRAEMVTLWIVVLGLRPALGQSSKIGIDAVAQTVVNRYVNDVTNQGEAQSQQGVWLQSEQGVLAQHQGTLLFPVASLTKIATTLAALQAWGPTYHFGTTVLTDGSVHRGVLQGNLVVQGGGDPFFVSENAKEVRRELRKLGITRVTGKLVVAGDFYMNFTTSPLLAGKLLKQALQDDGKRTPARPKKRGKTRFVQPRKPAEPTVVIAGGVQIVGRFEGGQRLLVRHYSLPLVQILKRMNIYSNNAMAEMLTSELGGPDMMAQRAAQAAGVPVTALHLINGSGLGAENQLAPRTVCALLAAIHRLLHPTAFTIADVFPVAGYDQGTIRRRHLPDAAVVKTGTLRNVSSLAGVLLTRDHGPVWFALVNQGGDLGEYRTQQDILLRALVRHWGTVDRPPPDFSPTGGVTTNASNDIPPRPKGEKG